MDDSLLDLSDDQLLVQETQMENSPATFSRKIINRLGIVGHPITGSETVDPTQQVTYFTMTYDIKILYHGIPNYQGSLNFHHAIIILMYMCNKIKIDV